MVKLAATRLEQCHPCEPVALGVQANVDCFSTEEGIAHSTDAHPFAEAIVQPPKLIEHLVTVQVRRDVGFRDVRHGAGTQLRKGKTAQV